MNSFPLASGQARGRQVFCPAVTGGAGAKRD